jgi:PEP-CTERM motif
MLRLCAISLFLSSVSFGSALTYTDYSSWSQAVYANHGGAVRHGFDVPELTFTTTSGMGIDNPNLGNGHLDHGIWIDEVGKGTSSGAVYDSTQINCLECYGIFATWTVQPGYSSGLELYALSDTSEILLEPFGNGYSGGWGFVSDQPISTLLLASSSGGVKFSVADLSLAAVTPRSEAPEPDTLMCLGLGSVALVLFARLGRKSKQWKAATDLDYRPE